MNIQTSTIETIQAMGYTVTFQDEFVNLVEPSKASEMYIGFLKVGQELQYIGKSIKATKKETTVEYVLDKINSVKTFKNFTTKFNKMVSKFGLSAYATSYGIGIFVAIGFRNSIQESKNQVENLLNELGVKFTTEYSEAGWVFRYKISKASENIALIESI